ncbi:MAG TPA: HAD family hydrolase [Vicinamibacterales bacterium]|jgi:putative hydrolase of the HAD superfamily
MPSTRAVFFDVDFTLIHPGPVFQGDGYLQFCAKHGIANCNPAAFEAAVGSASALLEESEDHAYDPHFFIAYIRHIIEQMGGSGGQLDACAEEIYREWAACHHFTLYDDVLPALRALHVRGIRLGLISNTHRSLESFSSHFELDALIACTVSSCEHGYNKPHPSIFRAALGLLSVRPEEAVMVGDSVRHDIEGARAVGMRAVLLRRSSGLVPSTIAEPGTAPGSDRVPVVRSLTELPALLD